MTDLARAEPASSFVDLWHQTLRMNFEAFSAFARASTGVTFARVGDVTVYFPFGSGYSQTIDPETSWGFISQSATERPEVEREIVEDVASYGKQIGRMMELLLAIAEKTPDLDPGLVSEVQQIRTQIDGVKLKHGIV